MSDLSYHQPNQPPQQDHAPKNCWQKNKQVSDQAGAQ